MVLVFAQPPRPLRLVLVDAAGHRRGTPHPGDAHAGKPDPRPRPQSHDQQHGGQHGHRDPLRRACIGQGGPLLVAQRPDIVQPGELVSLSFARDERAPSNDEMARVADEYLRRRGVGELDQKVVLDRPHRVEPHAVGEHDLLDEEQGKLYRDRYGRGSRGAGWYSFDADGVHFIGLVNVVNLKAGGLGNLGNEQLEWLEDDVKGRSASQPIVVFAHIPLWTIYPDWGWGTQDGARALSYLRKFGSVTVLNGHIHQVMQKVEGNVTSHTARSTAFPQPVPGTALSPGPIKVPEDKLRTMLGTASVTFKQNEQRLAIIDAPLQG